MIPRRFRIARPLLLVCAAAFLFAAAPAGAVTPSVSVGYYHSCAVEGSGTLKCFGYNASGESTATSPTANYVQPTAINLGGKVLQSASGYEFSCALIEGGAVNCWGAGDYGALGNGDTSDSPTPVNVLLGGPATAVASGSYSSCAIMATGNVKCWGYAGYGQLGNSDLVNDQATPVDVNLGGNRAVALATGYSETCVIVENGGLWCWGENSYDSINPSDSSSFIATPTQIDLGAPVLSVGADYQHICAVVSGGTVKCWGADYDGQVGDGSPDNSPAPVTTVSLGEPATKVTIGWYHSCAQLQSGAVKCWGDNSYGQISSDSSTSIYSTPIDYDAGGAIRDIVANHGSTCAIRVDNALTCSGYYVPYYMDPSSNSDYQYGPLLLAGVDMTLPKPPGPSPIAGKIAKPKWKLSRKGSKITASATLTVTADGMDATHCVGNLQVSVPASGDSGSGKKSTAPTFALGFANGKCTAKAKRTLPLRVAKKGARLKVYMKNPTLLMASPVTTTTKLPK